MHPYLYDTMRRQSKDPRQLRYQLVVYAREQGVKPAARRFATTPKTVRKWLRRWSGNSLEGLADQSRAPKHPVRRVSPAERARALRAKRRLPSFGAQRIRELEGLQMSVKAIRKCWREEGLLKTKRKKRKTKQDLRAVKANWRLGQQLCMDTKDLDDIPELWPQIQQHKLPTIQYTVREVVSGLQYIAYARQRALCYSALFAQYVLDHLQRCGLDLHGSVLQTDNGSEFIGAWNARDDSVFTQTVHAVPGLIHGTIPPGAHTWQSDVETVPRLIEDEFYEVERFHSRSDFLAKAATYNLWFNVARTNSHKEHQTPWQIIHQRDKNISPHIVLLPPVFLDELFAQHSHYIPAGGYHVVPGPL